MTLVFLMVLRESQALAGLSNEVHTGLELLRRVSKDGSAVDVLEVSVTRSILVWSSSVE